MSCGGTSCHWRQAEDGEERLQLGQRAAVEQGEEEAAVEAEEEEAVVVEQAKEERWVDLE
jgi:hypothetical protein